MKKLLSVVLAICVMVSAMGAMPAMATTASVGGSVGGGASSGGGGSASGGSGSTSGGTSSGTSAPAVMDLYSNGIECNSGSFFAGDLALDGYITTIDTEYDVFAVLAQYDNSGALIKTDIRKETVSPTDPYIYAALYNVSVVGKVKAMLLRADSLMPIVPSKEYSAYGRSVVVDASLIDSGIIDYSQYSMVEYYADNDAVRTTTIDIAPNAAISVNGTSFSYSQLDTCIYTDYNANLRFMETTGDKYFDAVAVTVYEYGIVDEVIPDRERVTFTDGNRLSLDSEDIEQIADIYDANGNRIGLSDIQPGDVLAMAVGDLNYDSYLPYPAKAFSSGKITIYNLGDKSVSGTMTGCSTSDRIFVIDGVFYDCAPVFVGSYSFDDVINILGLGVSAKFYLGMDGRIIGCDDTGFDNRGYKYGIVLQSAYLSAGFSPHYQLKLLTEDEGIVIYDVEEWCEIDGESCYSDSQNALAFEKYDNSVDNPADRFVGYSTNKSGYIDEIRFLGNDTISVDGECTVASSVRVDGNTLYDETFVFCLDCADIEETYVTDVSKLLDGNKYTGYVFYDDPDKYYDVFIIQSGELVSDDTGTAEPDTEEPVVTTTKTGFIIQTALNTNTFEPHYQAKILVEGEGIVIYEVATKCRVDGENREVSGSVDEQTEVIGFDEYTAGDTADAQGRLINYKLNTNGEINSIEFISDNGVSVRGKFDASACTIGDVAIDENAVVFYLDCADVDFCHSMSVADLTDGNEYRTTYINDEIVLVFVEGICYDGSDVYVVDSVIKTTYNANDAVQVVYYVDGQNDLNNAIFTDDSIAVAGSYSDLLKGSTFVAHINDDGFVRDYAVIAVSN